jgi:hypothetical protein
MNLDVRYVPKPLTSNGKADGRFGKQDLLRKLMPS